eukprot:Pgem_evm1s2805
MKFLSFFSFSLLIISKHDNDGGVNGMYVPLPMVARPVAVPMISRQVPVPVRHAPLTPGLNGRQGALVSTRAHGQEGFTSRSVSNKDYYDTMFNELVLDNEYSGMSADERYQHLINGLLKQQLQHENSGDDDEGFYPNFYAAWDFVKNVFSGVAKNVVDNEVYDNGQNNNNLKVRSGSNQQENQNRKGVEFRKRKYGKGNKHGGSDYRYSEDGIVPQVWEDVPYFSKETSSAAQLLQTPGYLAKAWDDVPSYVDAKKNTESVQEEKEEWTDFERNLWED